MSSNNAEMNSSQKTIMRDFATQYYALMEKYWNPSTDDTYWDDITDDAMQLISRFQTKDVVLNSFLQNIVVAFVNSREELIS